MYLANRWTLPCMCRGTWYHLLCQGTLPLEFKVCLIKVTRGSCIVGVLALQYVFVFVYVIVFVSNFVSRFVSNFVSSFVSRSRSVLPGTGYWVLGSRRQSGPTPTMPPWDTHLSELRIGLYSLATQLE